METKEIQEGLGYVEGLGYDASLTLAQRLRAAAVAGDLQGMLWVLRPEIEADRSRRLHLRNIKAKAHPLAKLARELEQQRAEVGRLASEVVPRAREKRAVAEQRVLMLGKQVEKAQAAFEDARKQLHVTFSEANAEKGRLKRQVLSNLQRREAELVQERAAAQAALGEAEAALRAAQARADGTALRRRKVLAQKQGSVGACAELDAVPRLVNAADERGVTAAMMAVDWGQLAAAKLLHGHGPPRASLSLRAHLH